MDAHGWRQPPLVLNNPLRHLAQPTCRTLHCTTPTDGRARWRRLIGTALRWVLLGTSVALAAIPWYSFTNLVPASTTGSLAEQPGGSSDPAPAPDATGDLPPTSTVVYYSYVYAASALTVLLVLLGLLRHGLPALSLRGEVSAAPELPGKAGGDGGAKSEQDAKEEERSQFMTDSGVTPKSGKGKGAVRRR
jgi:hypothetical protein